VINSTFLLNSFNLKSLISRGHPHFFCATTQTL